MLLQPKKLYQLKDYQKIGQKIEGIYLKIPELDPDITDFVILIKFDAKLAAKAAI